MKTEVSLLWGVLLGAAGLTAAADPLPGDTTVLGPFTGHYAPLHPDNLTPPVRYYGTDLGWTYEHQGVLHFLFGDTNATEADERIQGSTYGLYDDAFGTIELSEWPDPARIRRGNVPLIRLGQNPGTDEVSALDPGHAMESFKTPVGGFSNGEREFAVFYTSKPRACRVDADCGAELHCDTGLGFSGDPWHSDRGITVACVDGDPGCNADPLTDPAGATVAGSGFCIDRTSSFHADTPAGRIGAVALKQLIGIRSLEDPRRYTDTREWLTNKFANVAIRTVQSFTPGSPRQDLRPAASTADEARVFLWGRPGFIGVGAAGRPLGLYFAYADLPAGPGFDWDVHYYAGSGADGQPRFSVHERDAIPADMDAARAGVQPEQIDIVDQMSLSFVPELGRWIQFYGGGMVNLPLPPVLPLCGVLEFFARGDCALVDMGNGAIRMRSAEHPWGPWTAPVDVLVGGDPGKLPLEHQYAPGGVLRHPACTAPGCETHTNSSEVRADEHGFLYGVNLIEQWTRAAGDGVDVIWNVSTWDPYRVVLVRTHIKE